MTESNENSRVTREEVEHIADLARISLTDTEVDDYIGQFDKILDRFDRLDSVEVDDDEDQDELENVVRPDIIEDSLDQVEALENASETKNGYFEGPSVN